MIDDDERILQDELDGALTPEEATRLRELLARSAAARERRLELETVFHALDQVEMEAAPADIKEGVMAAIKAGPRPAPVRAGWHETLGAAFRGRPAFARAYPFLAGAVAGGLVIAIVTGSLGPRTRTDLPVAGTMMPRPGPGTLMDQLELKLGGARVSVQARLTADGLQVGFVPVAARGIELALAFDPRALRPVGLRWARPGEHQAELAAGRLRLRLTDEDQGTLLLGRTGPEDAPIQVEIHSGEGTAQGVLHTAAVGPGR
jgi:hypothetical protein